MPGHQLAVEAQHQRDGLLGDGDRAPVREHRHRHSGRSRGVPIHRPGRPPLHLNQPKARGRADQIRADAPLRGHEGIRAGRGRAQFPFIHPAAPGHLDAGLVRRLLEEALDPVRKGFYMECSHGGIPLAIVAANGGGRAGEAKHGPPGRGARMRMGGSSALIKRTTAA